MRNKALFIGTVIGLGILLTSCAKRQPYKPDIQKQFTEFFSTKIIGVEVVDNDLRIMLNNKIFFDRGEAKLKEEAKVSLNQVIEVYLGQILPIYPNSTIIVEGYADSDGNEAFNLDLSQGRAVSVVSYLSSETLLRYIDKSRLSSVGYGEAFPRVPNNSKENRAINRRVELIFKGMGN